MKKRIICLVLMILMVLPFILTSCEKEMSEQELMEQIRNAQDGKIATTLSIWIPTNSVVNELPAGKSYSELSDEQKETFSGKLLLVEEAINKKLSASYLYKVDLIAVSADEYEQKLNEKLESAKNDPSPLPSVVADKYVNVVEKNDLGLYEIVYPELLSNQIDIFYISGKDNYTELAAQDLLYDITSYLHEQSGVYNDIRKMIYSSALEAYKVNDKYYALPNNHSYISSDCKYLLVNKELFQKYYGEDADISEISSLLDCEEFINLVGNSALETEIPFVGNMDLASMSNILELPNFGGHDFDLVAGTYADANPNVIFKLKEYTDYISLYKRLAEAEYAYSENDEVDGDVAVRLLSGNIADLEKYENEYYIVRTEVPFIEEENLFEGMFAISKYSANYEKAMHLLYLLQTDEDLITLLQYGVNNETYTLGTNEDGEEIVNLITDRATGETIYDMSGIYLGNGYRTYMANGKSVEDWENVKFLLNYGMINDPYANLMKNFEGQSTAKLDELHIALEGVQQSIFEQIDAMTADEFDYFVMLYNLDLTELNTEIQNFEKKAERSKEEEAAYQELLAMRTAYNENELIDTLTSTSFRQLVSLYQNIYSTCK